MLVCDQEITHQNSADSTKLDVKRTMMYSIRCKYDGARFVI